MSYTVNLRALGAIMITIGSLCSFKVHAQTTSGEKEQQLNRIAAFGKAWGVINYFHPQMGKGQLNSDSLFLQYIRPLTTNPSATNFKTGITGMLADLHDPQSGIVTTDIERKHNSRKSYSQQQLPGGVLYIALPQDISGSSLKIDSVLRNNTASDIILDLRCDTFNYEPGLQQYTTFIQPLVAGIIDTTMILPTERSFFYKGLMRQDFQHSVNLMMPDKDGNIPGYQVNMGFRNAAQGSYIAVDRNKKISGKRYCFIINQYVNVNIVSALMALRNRNLCYLVVEDKLPDYAYGSFYKMQLPDGITAKIRCSEMIYEDGTAGMQPDIIKADNNGTLINDATNLFTSAIRNTSAKHIENTVYIRTPATMHSTAGTPDASLRLLGLFNFWNTIHFFSPNKQLISVDWERSLPRFIDIFLKANDEEKYFMALMELTAAISDGHAILYNTKSGRSPKGILDGNLPFVCDVINRKIYVTSIMPDTTQRQALSDLQYGDEVVAIDNIHVDSIIKKWKPLLVASNESGFNRELYATWFTAGSIGSTAIVRVSRNKKLYNITLKRIDRNMYYNLWGQVPRQATVTITNPPFCKVLPGNIGYLRLNKVYSKDLDSISVLLKNCAKIIIDARGYPKDARIGTNIAAYIAKKTDTAAYELFPYVTSPDLLKRQTLIDYAVIEPNTNPYLKNKKYYLLVDEGNQSQGEWNPIAIQGVTKAITIGRTTAGANGMAVTIPLPGDYMTFYSGFAEYYPDHTPNQRLGVKIDVIVNKTLKGAIRGEDEILNKALELCK